MLTLVLRVSKLPTFDYKCESCQNREDDEFVVRYDDKVICSKCGNIMTKIPCFPNVITFPLGGVYLEHVSPDGKKFHSKQEMLKYEKSHDIYIDCAH